MGTPIILGISLISTFVRSLFLYGACLLFADCPTIRFTYTFSGKLCIGFVLSLTTATCLSQSFVNHMAFPAYCRALDTCMHLRALCELISQHNYV